jgi:Ras-related GTP-binding protein C/D
MDYYDPEPGPFPTDHLNDINDLSSPSAKPKILLMGLRRSGKSSIQKVVFQKMSPHETLFLESSVKVTKHDVSNNSFVQFQIWDFPGQIDLFDPTFDADAIFGNCGSLVFIIDSQEDTVDAEQKLVDTVVKAHEVNSHIVFEVFIHKVDGLSDDHKIDLHRNLQQRVTEELNVQKHTSIHLSFHQTSIYDHSVFEAFSKVIQKLIPQLPILENLLDMFISNSRIEKAFLFDVLSKIYIATDSSPVDNTTYELCSDMIDVVIDVSSIYGVKPPTAAPPANGFGGTSAHRSAPEDEIPTGGLPHGAFPYDQQSASLIKLSNGMVLYLRQVNRYLALVCLMRVDTFSKFGLINYNFETFKTAIKEVFEVRLPANGGS